VQPWLSQFLDLSGCEEIWNDHTFIWQELAGRNRLRASVIINISKSNFESYEDSDPIKNKQNILKNTIGKSITQHHDKMFIRLTEACCDRKDVVSLLKHIVASSTLFGNIPYAPTTEDLQNRDLVNVGICRLTQTEDSFKWQLAEPLALRVAKEVLQKLGQFSGQIVLDNALKAVFDTMNMLGPKAAEKGKRAEILTAAQIVHSWNGKTLADLDIVTSNIKTIAIPKWMTEVVINIKNFGTAQQLGFPDDLEVIKAIKSGSLKEHVLLFPANLMGPDMLLLI